MPITREQFDVLTAIERAGTSALSAQQDGLRRSITAQGLIDGDSLSA